MRSLVDLEPARLCFDLHHLVPVLSLVDLHEQFWKLSECQDILTKSLGSNTPANVVKATVNGFKKLRTISQVARLRGKTIAEITGQKITVVEEEAK